MYLCNESVLYLGRYKLYWDDAKRVDRVYSNLVQGPIAEFSSIALLRSVFLGGATEQNACRLFLLVYVKFCELGDVIFAR